MKKIFTSESVNIGHPDKTCDTIADAFLDEALKQDKFAQMALECAIKNNKLFIYGETTTSAKVDFDKVAREVLSDIGYDAEKFDIIKEISEQSPDINQAVVGTDFKAGDQGMVFGFATNETKEYMPLPIVIAHKLMKKYEEFRKTTKCYYADAKSEVSVEYDENKIVGIDTILISVSHAESLSHDEIETDIMEFVVEPVLEEYEEFDNKEIKFYINTSGKFTIWGSYGDSGCVGRKIIVDTYGGMGRVGGGCFSSKNATKVDRSAAYYARYVAKNIVAHGLADKCEIEVAYAIGLADPISMTISTFGTNKTSEENIQKFVLDNFSFNVNNIISELDLLRPIYKQTACYGHFGRDEFPWEKIKEIEIK
jgi:S-adenosylmethionine synthetase